jgi:Xaa-Pro aminopeptidase
MSAAGDHARRAAPRSPAAGGVEAVADDAARARRPAAAPGADVAASACAERLARLASGLGARGLDGLLVQDLHDVRYLTGFTGSHGLALVAAAAPDRGRIARHRFLTDFRYATQSAEQVAQELVCEIVRDDLLEALARLLAAGGPAGSCTRARTARLGFDDRRMSVAQHTRLRESLGMEWELVPCADAVRDLRAVKDAGEIARIRAACELAEEALTLVLGQGVVGRSERDVAVALELAMRRLGARAPSFPSIVAAGGHAALPHAEPRETPIPPDVLLTIDWGALHDGYCSDCTRTYATGEGVGQEARELYELVRRTQRLAVAAVRPGPNGRWLDAIARAEIEAAGYGEHFGHGLGHGVGMEVHEEPRLSRTAGEEPLQAGNVVTVEPGVYLPGSMGVRIEDLVVVTQDGHEVLTSLPRELTVVS